MANDQTAVGIKGPLSEGEEPQPSILSGLVILNICNEMEQRIQINPIGDE